MTESNSAFREQFEPSKLKPLTSRRIFPVHERSDDPEQDTQISAPSASEQLTGKVLPSPESTSDPHDKLRDLLQLFLALSTEEKTRFFAFLQETLSASKVSPGAQVSHTPPPPQSPIEEREREKEKKKRKGKEKDKEKKEQKATGPEQSPLQPSPVMVPSDSRTLASQQSSIQLAASGTALKAPPAAATSKQSTPFSQLRSRQRHTDNSDTESGSDSDSFDSSTSDSSSENSDTSSYKHRKRREKRRKGKSRKHKPEAAEPVARSMEDIKQRFLHSKVMPDRLAVSSSRAASTIQSFSTMMQKHIYKGQVDFCTWLDNVFYRNLFISGGDDPGLYSTLFELSLSGAPHQTAVAFSNLNPDATVEQLIEHMKLKYSVDRIERINSVSSDIHTFIPHSDSTVKGLMLKFQEMFDAVPPLSPFEDRLFLSTLGAAFRKWLPPSVKQIVQSGATLPEMLHQLSKAIHRDESIAYLKVYIPPEFAAKAPQDYVSPSQSKPAKQSKQPSNTSSQQNSSSQKQPKSQRSCYNCDRKNHLISECHAPCRHCLQPGHTYLHCPFISDPKYSRVKYLYKTDPSFTADCAPAHRKLAESKNEKTSASQGQVTTTAKPSTPATAQTPSPPSGKGGGRH